MKNTPKSIVEDSLATSNNNRFSLKKEQTWKQQKTVLAKIVNHAKNMGESSQALKIIQSAAVSSVDWLDEPSQFHMLL